MKTILVVDDEPVLREILREILEAESYKVLEADGGNKAFSIVQKEQIDCLITDIRMPAGNGMELIRNIHEWSGRKPKIIVMTAYGDIDLEAAKKHRVSRIISKPFEPAAILNELKVIFSKSV